MSSDPPRDFSYDTRIRNTPMESSRQSAKEALLEGIAKLEEIIPTMNFDEVVVLNAVTPFMHSFKSTLGREVCDIVKLIPKFQESLLSISCQVWFASLHCVHHWSMVSLWSSESFSFNFIKT